MLSLKNRYPWRLGATSGVLPADIASNVRFLAPLVDAVQLLFFESEAKSLLPNPIDLDLLRDQPLIYTVHLPADLALGSDSARERGQAIDEILRLMERLAPLSPYCYDLHCNREADLTEACWLDRLATGLATLANRLGSAKNRIAIENIEYPYPLIAPLVRELGFGVCLDLGHLKYHGHGRDLPVALGEVRHIHYHGVKDGKDHQALNDREAATALGRELAAAGFAGVLTLEVYNTARLEASLALLDTVWQGRGKDLV